ncbi:MAG: helix-turn-helix domain-containing protein, partial [Coprobacillus sp.]
MENKILKILNQNKNEYISGQMMSSQLNVSRMSISSYIKKLKEKGYHIKTSTKKGYCLT